MVGNRGRVRDGKGGRVKAGGKGELRVGEGLGERV